MTRKTVTGALASAAAAFAALAVALLAIVATGHSAGASISAFWDGSFGSRMTLAGTLEDMIPLVLVAYGWILVSSTRRVSIGFEGQILAGGVLATVVAVHVHGLPRVVHLPLAIVGGMVGGAIWAALPAALLVFRRVSELLSTFMLNFIAVLLVNYLVQGPMQDPTLPQQSSPVPASASWPRFGTSALTWDILYVPVAALAFLFLLRRTTIGLRLRILSANDQLARHLGMRVTMIGALALIASGALAGLAGSSLILSSQFGTMQDGFSASYGWDGIAVALLARNSPLACLPAALLLASLRQGGGFVAASAGVPTALFTAAEGLVIIFVIAFALVFNARFAGRGARDWQGPGVIRGRLSGWKGLRWGHSTPTG